MSRTVHHSTHRRLVVAFIAAAGLSLATTSARAQSIPGERALLNRTTAAFTSAPGASNARVIDGKTALLGNSAEPRAQVASAPVTSVAIAPAIDGTAALLGRRAVRIDSSASTR